MSRRPDFYCFFYCAARDGQREPRAARYGTGSRPSSPGTARARCETLDAGLPSSVARSSGSRGVKLKAQRLIPNGRPGIDGLRVWQTSPLGSNRRGR